MNEKAKAGLFLALVPFLVVGALLIGLWRRPRLSEDGAVTGLPLSRQERVVVSERQQVASLDLSADLAEASKPAAEVSERRLDQLMTEFYDETDRWVRGRAVESSDVKEFVRRLQNVPMPQRRACLQRALNLIPDANCELLKGVLFDRSQPDEIVRLVFRDFLRRAETISASVLGAIAKDKTHPCCSDAEWIFEVTGEKPK